MEDILTRAKKVAEEAEVFMASSEETPVQFEANRLKHIQSKQASFVALRIIKGGRVGYAVSTELNDRKKLVEAAMETAEFGIRAEFTLPGATVYPGITVFDPAVESVSPEEMVGLGSELVDIVRKHTPEILCDDVVLRQLDLARETAPIATKPLPVIFTPDGVASAIVSPLMVALNGKVVLQGASPIGSKVGEQIFDGKLSLHDDPTIGYRPQSRPADDEGTPSQRTPLITQGRVAGFIYDLQTAALARKKSTGNGGRHHGGLPSPTPSAFIFTAGDTAFDDMVSDIKEGLIIEQLMGAEQGNILSGDFSGNVLLGYKVESGKIVGRVKDTMVSGNIYQLLKDITAVGSDARWVGSSVYTPSLYCPSLSVASK